MTIDWAKLINPYSPAFQKFTLELIKEEKYSLNQEAIEKISNLVTDKKSYELMAKLFVHIWESGFFKSVEEQKEQLKKMGIKITVSSEIKKKDENQI